MLKDIVDVRVADDRRLRLRFEDGAEGEIDVATIVPFEGVFAPLRDPEVSPPSNSIASSEPSAGRMAPIWIPTASTPRSPVSPPPI